ncbi:hypothetical protein BGZ94_001397 [Podila epigama]|nr:hypothetical protein BGZ94_001397 [Podila epigama]
MANTEKVDKKTTSSQATSSRKEPDMVLELKFASNKTIRDLAFGEATSHAQQNQHKKNAKGPSLGNGTFRSGFNLSSVHTTFLRRLLQKRRKSAALGYKVALVDEYNVSNMRCRELGYPPRQAVYEEMGVR